MKRKVISAVWGVIDVCPVCELEEGILVHTSGLHKQNADLKAHIEELDRELKTASYDRDMAKAKLAEAEKTKLAEMNIEELIHLLRQVRLQGRHAEARRAQEAKGPAEGGGDANLKEGTG